MTSPQTARWMTALDEAMKANASQAFSRFMQLATIKSAKTTPTPAVRTVVFRGFRNEDRRQLLVTTNSYSKKIKQIQTNPNGELCWYFTETREQFRLTGKVLLSITTETQKGEITEEERIDAWRKMSPTARYQFLLATHPGTPVDPEKDVESSNKIEDEDRNRQSKDNEALPPDSFALIVFKVDKVDYLLLMPGQRRFVSKFIASDNRWDEQEVHP
eukprot:TRINITY_DN8178_c0_g1_i1.p1 TRINITY_DN8178_c0_g1~~TRINITY_DN8178_c0_g1_i1.p1  ORF type:complete len:229 (-),score=50.05 TRINITY_DN8178_c0_g1_i1:66-713(-)